MIASALLCTSLSLLCPRSDPPALVVRDVRLSPEDDAPRRSILVREGRIEAIVDAAQEPPPGRRVIEGGGRLVLPAFVDAWTQAGLVVPARQTERERPFDARVGPPLEMPEVQRKGVRAAFRACDTLALDDKARAAWREAGFGALCVAPAGELLGGAGALVTPRELAPRDALLREVVLQHAAFAASGPGYPSTLMGYCAQLRQTFLDAARHGELVARRADGRPGPRPPLDPDLEAVTRLAAGKARLACEAQRAADAERWLALASELGFSLALVGGRDLWEIAPRLAELGVPVVLTCEWGDEVVDPDAEDRRKQAKPDEPDRWRYEAPLRVRREERRLWEERRDCALRLDEAGVRTAFGTGGGKPAELLKRVRELVAAGLPRESALRSLTSAAAELCGVGAELGRLEPGRDASFALWSADPLVSREAKILWIVLEGEPYEGEALRASADEPPRAGLDLSGLWELELGGEGARAASLRLTMEKDGRVRGTLELIEPGAREPRRGELEGRLRGERLELDGRMPAGLFETEVGLRARVRGDELDGELEWRWSEGRDASAVSGRRVVEPEGAPR